MTDSPYKSARLLLCVVAIAVGALNLATSAQADGEVPWSPQADIAYRVALDYWNTTEPPAPLCRQVQKVLVDGGTESATVQQRGVSTAFDGNCLLVLNGELPFEVMCNAAVHAVGHFVGKDDSSDPNAGVMYVGALVPVELCSVETLRLEGYGHEGEEAIGRIRTQCEALKKARAKHRRVAACRTHERRVRAEWAIYLEDPYRT